MQMKRLTNGLDFLTNARLKIKATSEEIEVSVFGKGFGECIIINCGQNEYVVIDSFINPVTKNPIAIDYLNSMNEPITSIKKMVVTHWHSDHIRGVSAILEKAGENIKIVLNPIIKHEEFNRFLQYGINEKQESTSEFNNILSIIKQRGPSCVVIAGCDKRIFSDEISTPVELFSLSPQDSEVVEYINALNTEQQDTSIEYLDNNLLSVVILMKYFDQGILLGGDMENSSNKNNGWNAIVNNYSHTSVHPSLFKVPHHGSSTGHNKDVWEKILADMPISVLSTYNKSTKLPKDTDVKRLVSLSKKVYVVGNKIKRDRVLEQKLRKNKSNISIELIPQDIGLVRYRRNITSMNRECLIETFGAVQEYQADKDGVDYESSNLCAI